MSTELPNQPDEPANQPPAREFPPPPMPRQAEAVDWSPPPPPQQSGWPPQQTERPPTPTEWPPAPTERIPSYGWAPPAKPPLDKVSLIALITAIPGFGLVSIPLGIWGVIRTKNHQRRGRTLAVISFVLIGLWAIVGAVVGVMAGLAVTSTTDQTAAPPPNGLLAPTTVPPAVSTAPVAASTIPGNQPHGPLRKAKKVYWDQLKVGDCFKGWTDTAVTVTRVDCRSPHEEEVTGTFDVAGGRHYPGDAAVQAASDARCKVYFARYVGIDWNSSSMNYAFAWPAADSWAAGDRETVCTADDPNHPADNRLSLRNIKE